MAIIGGIMRCQKYCLLFIMLCGLSFSLHSQSISQQFVSIYNTIDKLESQTIKLNNQLLLQKVLSQQLQEQLNKSTQDLATCQSNLMTASQQLQQSQTALQQASKDAEMQKKQLQNLEKKYKIWRNVSIAATITTVVTTAAILILIRK